MSRRKTQTSHKINLRAVERLRRRVRALNNVVFSVIALVDMMRSFFAEDIPAICRDTLRAMGLNWGDDDPLTMAGFTDVVSRQTGIQFSDLSDPEATKDDIADFAFGAIDDAIGFRPTSLDPAVIKEELRTWLLGQIENPNAIVPGATFVQQMQHVARDAYRDGATTRAPRGWSVHLARWSHREAQRRYGMTHVQVWEWGDLYSERSNVSRMMRLKSEKNIKRAWKWNNVVWRNAIEGKNSKGEPVGMGLGMILDYNPSGRGMTKLEVLRARERKRKGRAPPRGKFA